jgi:hypothetical protein
MEAAGFSEKSKELVILHGTKPQKLIMLETIAKET